MTRYKTVRLTEREWDRVLVSIEEDTATMRYGDDDKGTSFGKFVRYNTRLVDKIEKQLRSQKGRG